MDALILNMPNITLLPPGQRAYSSYIETVKSYRHAVDVRTTVSNWSEQNKIVGTSEAPCVNKVVFTTQTNIDFRSHAYRVNGKSFNMWREIVGTLPRYKGI